MTIADFFSRFLNIKSLERESNFELAKIYASILVLMHHVIIFHYNCYSNQYPGLTFWHTVTMKCNNIFIASSSYFLCNSSFKLSRPIVLYLQTLIYSYMIFVFECIKKNEKFNLQNNMKYSMIITNENYWFPVAFIIAQVFFTGIIQVYKKMNLLGQLIVFFLFYYTSFIEILGHKNTSVVWDYGKNVYFMLLCMLVGAIIKLNNIKISSTICVIGIFVSIILYFESLMHYFRKFTSNQVILKLLECNRSYAPLPMINTAFVLLLVQNWKVPKIIGYFVNFLAQQNYFVYLYHTHPIYKWIIYKIFDDQGRKDLAYKNLLPHTFVIYFKCLLVTIPATLILNFILFNAGWFNSLLAKIDQWTLFSEENYQNVHVNQNNDIHVDADIHIEVDDEEEENEEKVENGETIEA